MSQLSDNILHPKFPHPEHQPAREEPVPAAQRKYHVMTGVSFLDLAVAEVVLPTQDEVNRKQEYYKSKSAPAVVQMAATAAAPTAQPDTNIPDSHSWTTPELNELNARNRADSLAQPAASVAIESNLSHTIGMHDPRAAVSPAPNQTYEGMLEARGHVASSNNLNDLALPDNVVQGPWVNPNQPTPPANAMDDRKVA